MTITRLVLDTASNGQQLRKSSLGLLALLADKDGVDKGDAGAKAEDSAKTASIVARGVWPHVQTTRSTPGSGDLFWVIRTQDDWAAVNKSKGLLSLAQALKVKEIDLTKQMVIAVRGANQPMVGVAAGPGPQQVPPPQPSTPSRVAIERIEKREGDALHVWWKFEPRDNEQVLSCPVAVALVPRMAGEVKFEQVKGRTPQERPPLAASR